MDGRGGEIVEKEADEIENGSGFEDDGVFAGSEFSGIFGARGFIAGSFRERQWIKGAEVCGVCLCPTGGGALLHGG